MRVRSRERFVGRTALCAAELCASAFAPHDLRAAFGTSLFLLTCLPLRTLRANASLCFLRSRRRVGSNSARMLCGICDLCPASAGRGGPASSSAAAASSDRQLRMKLALVAGGMPTYQNDRNGEVLVFFSLRTPLGTQYSYRVVGTMKNGLRAMSSS